MSILESLVFKYVAPGSINYLNDIDYKSKDELVRAVFGQLRREFQIVPPITLHLPNPRVMAAVWGMGRECFVANNAGRKMREIVAASVSDINKCPYCVDVHTAMLHGAGAGDLAEGLRRGDTMEKYAEFAHVIRWARATLTPGSEVLQDPPFSRKQAPQIIGTALYFHYLNRMVNIFLDESPLPIPNSKGNLKSKGVKLFGTLVGRRLVGLDAIPGEFLINDIDSELPEVFAWAKDDAHVAGALARWWVVAEEAARESVSPAVRKVVQDTVRSWHGSAPGLSRSWVDRVIMDIEEKEKPYARLALLAALASYQIDRHVMTEVRAQGATDRDLINITSWAATLASARIASWLKLPTCDAGA
jgi:AhpD family alkylhydroperoxidase